MNLKFCELFRSKDNVYAKCILNHTSNAKCFVSINLTPEHGLSNLTQYMSYHSISNFVKLQQTLVYLYVFKTPFFALHVQTGQHF